MNCFRSILTTVFVLTAMNSSALEIIIARHGETAWNSEGRFQGHTDIPLNEMGRVQAQELSDALEHLHFDAIYASDLARAQETASMIAASRGLAVRQERLWREICFGRFEGLRRDEFDFQELLGLLQRPGLEPEDGVETIEAFHQRLAGIFETLRQSHADDERVLVLAHGGVLRGVLEAAVDNSAALPIRYDNCGYIVIHSDGDGARAVRCHRPLPKA